MISVTTPCQDVKPNTFMIEGNYTEFLTIVVSCPTTVSLAHCHLKGHVKGIIMSVHSYAYVTLSGLFHESASVTACNPP